MKPLKYVITPGWVTAKDGDRHFITGERLIDLYNVPKNECVIVPNMDAFKYGPQHLQTLIWLYPREDGDYHL